jgi:hypothetical protein
MRWLVRNGAIEQFGTLNMERRKHGGGIPLDAAQRGSRPRGAEAAAALPYPSLEHPEQVRAGCLV